MAPAVRVFAEYAGEGRLELYGKPSGAWGERAAQGADAEDSAAPRARGPFRDGIRSCDLRALIPACPR